AVRWAASAPPGPAIPVVLPAAPCWPEYLSSLHSPWSRDPRPDAHYRISSHVEVKQLVSCRAERKRIDGDSGFFSYTALLPFYDGRTLFFVWRCTSFPSN